MAINEKFQKQLNDQVVAEHQAALVYTQLAYELDRLSFPGMRDWMVQQAAEERVHARKFARHLLDREARVDIETIEMPSLKISTPLDAFEASLGDLAEGEEGGRQISLKRHILTVKRNEGRLVLHLFELFRFYA